MFGVSGKDTAKWNTSIMYRAEASVGVCRNDLEAWMGYKKVLFFAAAHQSVLPRSMTSSVEKGSVDTCGLCTWLAQSVIRI